MTLNRLLTTLVQLFLAAPIIYAIKLEIKERRKK